VHLNNILREVETCVRDAEGVVVATTPYISVVRVRPGEALPPGGLDRPAKLAVAGNIDFINPVRDAAYRKKIPLPKQMYLQRIRRKCEEVAYNSVDEFLSDMRQIVENARQYHTAPEAHWVVQHAEYLHEAAEEELKKRQQDIDEAIQRDAQAP
jgi:DNA-directed RNA polymerase beta' subunit